ncbi:MAG TPA: tRNA (guanosine(37)-N1)-methyltransferase TrmD [Firmicutes bacterium]|nr:tRNA (guanosine(37)-N1)-methyltransferase TrmD [Bacillota bacterium]
MKIDILSLFPGMFDGFLNESIIKRAINKGLVEVNIIDFRKYSKLSNSQVDDTPYGGGGGMVLRIEPIYDALMDIKKDSKDAKVILMTPDGVPYKQSIATSLKNEKHLIFICGHYEGFDERIRSLCDMEISIGDYVLTGGELPAMIISDSIIRLLPGVITNTSLDSESFNDKLLDYPTYTKPQEFMGMKVPDVLVNGHHAKIEAWRKEKQIERTKERRPDLLD